MRSSPTSVLTSGRFCWVFLVTGIHALPNPANHMIFSPSQPSKSRYEIRAIYPRTETGSLGQGQDFKGNTSSLASEPILYHENTTFLTPSIIIALVLFLTFAAGIITVFFYGHGIRMFLLKKMRQHKKEEPEVEERAAGFGFDGLTEAEKEAHRWKEETEAVNKPFWHIKLPTKPPVLVLEPSLSPPISLDDTKMPLEDSKVDELEARVDDENGLGVEVHAPTSLEQASYPGAVGVTHR